MQSSDNTRKTVQETTKDDAGNAQETGRRWCSGLVVALLLFVVAYAVFATTFGHWGLVLGWMPASMIAAAFGWIGYCLPWIGEPSPSCGICSRCFPCSANSHGPHTTEMACNELDYPRYDVVLDDEAPPRSCH